MQATQTESSSSEQSTQPSLEKRLDSLEKDLRKSLKITWKDRLSNVMENLFNTGYLSEFPPWLGLVGTVAVGALSYYFLDDSIGLDPANGLEDVGRYIRSLLDVRTIPEINVEFTPEVFCTLEETMRQSLLPIKEVPVEILDFTQRLYEESVLFTSQEEAQGVDYVLKLIEINEQAQDLYSEFSEKDSKETSFLLGLASGAFGAIGAFNSMMDLVQKSFELKDYNKRKRQAQKFVKERFPKFREELKDHPHASEVLTFAEILFGRRGSIYETFTRIDRIIKYTSPDYAHVFSSLNDPQTQSIATENLRELLTFFDEEKKRSAQNEESIKSAIQRTELLFDLQLRGASHHTASQLIRFAEQFSEAEEREYFTQKLRAPDFDPSLFESIVEFYKSFPNIPGEKRFAMAKYLFKRGSRQYAKQLQTRYLYSSETCTLYDKKNLRTIMDYVSGLDQVPGVGVKGQVETLIQLNGAAQSSREGSSQISYEGLARIVEQKRSEFGKGATTVARFLARHPNVSAGETLGALIEYYRLAGEEGFSSKWIRKEEIKLGEHEPKESALNKRGERKFLEELERKIELVRYERFRDEIEESYYAPLTHLLGESVTRSKDVAMSPELMNVIGAYSKEGNLSEHYKKKLKKIISIWAKGPSSSAQKISQLPGNQSLEERLGAKKLAAWREGHSRSYITALDNDLEKRLQQEVQSEFEELLRCATQLGYEVKEDDSIASAEAIYKTIANLEIEEEKRYLLEEAKHHLQRLKQEAGTINNNTKSVHLYDSKDPIESLQMGIVSGSCTNIMHGINSFAAVVNTLDDNKKVIYMKNESGERVGRTLAVLTNKGVVTYRKYDNSNRKTDAQWVDYFHGYAKQVGTALIVPTHFVTPGLKVALRSRGAKTQTVSPRLHKAVCGRWYDDRGVGRVKIPEKGYKKSFRAYVLQ